MKEDPIFDLRLITLREVPERCVIPRWKMMFYHGTPIEVNLSVEFRKNRISHVLTLVLGVHYTTLRSQIEQHILDYELEADFEIIAPPEVEAAEKGDIVVTNEMMRLMLSVGIGAVRGMVALRTENTFLRHYPLPIYDLSVLMDDIFVVGEDIA